MSCRFQRLREKLGEKYALYDLRHGFAPRMLTCGADTLTVAAIMGHADGKMIAQHYAHLDRRMTAIPNGRAVAERQGAPGDRSKPGLSE